MASIVFARLAAMQRLQRKKCKLLRKKMNKKNGLY